MASPPEFDDDRGSNNGSSNTKGSGSPNPANLLNVVFVVVVLTLLLFGMLSMFPWQPESEISYTFFLSQIEAKNVSAVQLQGSVARGKFRDAPLVSVAKAEGTVTTPTTEEAPPKEPADSKKAPDKLYLHFRVDIPPGANNDDRLVEKVRENGGSFSSVTPTDPTPSLMLGAITISILMFVLFWVWFRRAQNQMMGGGIFSSFAKSTAKRYEGSKQPITFKDVAGLDGVKADLMELVDFLRLPERFQKLGGRVPKGVLLNGPPGTGKTLLARAVAGEAGVPFFSVSGSEFIQMFVGVGASRVRDLFKQAKDASPAIIFIDEIDAVGRQRGAGLGGGHDEREQTLNQILSEMDGFNQTDFVIVIAATNRPDVLDPALLRPGRFDRHITVGRPTHKGRKEILKVHVRHVPLADDVDLDSIASGTIGLTGADLRNIVNEAALWAARHDKTKVDMSDFEFARDKILMGPKREEILKDKEKEKTAYHEAGHTLLSWTLPGAHRVHKVTIVPRGRALGVTQTIPSEDRLSVSQPELLDHLVMMLGGREAEKLIYNEVTVGAENDLERATGLARRMVMNWGMSERLGPVSYKLSEEDPFLGREMHQQRAFSEHTMEMIDGEVARILREASETAQKNLKAQQPQLEKIARALLENEELDENEITKLIGPSIHHVNGNGKPPVETIIQPGPMS